MNYVDVLGTTIGLILAIFFPIGMIAWVVKYWTWFAAGLSVPPLWFGITVTVAVGVGLVVALFLLGKWLYKKFKKKE